MPKNVDFTAALGLPPLPVSSPDTIAGLLWARDVIQKHLTTVYSIKDSKGIEELKSVKICGVDQWLHIRGRNKNNPVLLWLHGGPGGSVIGCGGDAVLRPWEDYFTIVLWDQRQTGKSYYPEKDETDPLTVQQFVEDTEEVVQYLRDYLNKDKLFILGASWGTVLGMHMVRRHPEWVYAYIGVGQVVNSIKAEKIAYQRLLSHASNRHESELVKKLEKIMPLLDSNYPEREKSFAQNCNFIRSELSRVAGEALMHHLVYEDAGKMFSLEKLLSPHLTLSDIGNGIFGDEAAIFRPDYAFTREFLDIDLPQDVGSSFDVPIFFFTGVHDWQTAVSLSDAWFNEITAPYKELVHFEESSHAVVNEEPGKFLIALVNKVLPFCEPEMNRGIRK